MGCQRTRSPAWYPGTAVAFSNASSPVKAGCSYGGVADKISPASRAPSSHVRGGLGMSNVLACTVTASASVSDYSGARRVSAIRCGGGPDDEEEGDIYAAAYAVQQ